MTDDRRHSDKGQESPPASDLLDRTGAIVAPDASALSADGTSAEPGSPGEGTRAPQVTGQLGSARYVHAAFIAAAILVGYIASQLFTLIWNRLAEAPWALRLVPQLVRYDEDVRGDVGLVVGAIVGIITVIRLYGRPKIRVWADEVAAELSKVSWPDREAITNNTVIVIVASLTATLYVTVLDRFWAFSTGLIYAP
jgi:preprotein translocase subunit SecE